MAEPVSFPHVERRELTGGTLTTNLFIVWQSLVSATESVISAYCWVLREHVSVFSRQEYAGFHCLADRIAGLFGVVVVVMVRMWVGVCVLFENCTVDASIFIVSSLERTVDALAPGADEGRRRLR